MFRLQLPIDNYIDIIIFILSQAIQYPKGKDNQIYYITLIIIETSIQSETREYVRSQKHLHSHK